MAKKPNFPQMKNAIPKPKTIKSLYEIMTDGTEYISLLGDYNYEINFHEDLVRGILEIEDATGNPLILYLANVYNPNNAMYSSIDNTDDIPFSEIISDSTSHETIDIMLVTPGGDATVVDSVVSLLRNKYQKVRFILPHMCMSAGTIFALSGDELIMGKEAFIGPIDPQVISKDGLFRPAQSVLTHLETLKQSIDQAVESGQQPSFAEIQMLLNMDPKEIGNAHDASEFSRKLVTNYLMKYKFKNWITRSNGEEITDEERETTARKIATHLCDHTVWQSHSERINRENAEEIGLKIIQLEDNPNLEKAVRRLWSVAYFAFEKTTICKILMNRNGGMFRNVNLPGGN